MKCYLTLLLIILGLRLSHGKNLHFYEEKLEISFDLSDRVILKTTNIEKVVPIHSDENIVPKFKSSNLPVFPSIPIDALSKLETNKLIIADKVDQMKDMFRKHMKMIDEFDKDGANSLTTRIKDFFSNIESSIEEYFDYIMYGVIGSCTVGIILLCYPCLYHFF